MLQLKRKASERHPQLEALASSDEERGDEERD
jgi:hypothetical protein